MRPGFAAGSRGSRTPPRSSTCPARPRRRRRARPAGTAAGRGCAPAPAAAPDETEPVEIQNIRLQSFRILCNLSEENTNYGFSFLGLANFFRSLRAGWGESLPESLPESLRRACGGRAGLLSAPARASGDVRNSGMVIARRKAFVANFGGFVLGRIKPIFE